MLITRKPKSAHWYMRDGTPFFEVPMKSRPGEMRAANIKDAYTAGAYRSVTSVLDLIGKPGLVAWQQEQAILAALTLPRRPDETEHDFAARAIIDADEQAEKAREDGRRLHLAASKFLTESEIPQGNDARLLMPFFDWCGANIAKVIASEKVVVNHAHFYAGTLDIKAVMTDGNTAIIDIKTQDVDVSAKGEPVPKFYPEWPMQLAAYDQCSPSASSRLISLVLDRLRPGCYPREWYAPGDVQPEASSVYYFKPFAHLCEVWAHYKKGVPGRDAKPSA